MIDTLITALKTILSKVYLQGALNPNEGYPDEFITYWTSYTEDGSHYDNSVNSINWSFQVIVYTNDRSNLIPYAQEITQTLREIDFIPDGWGAEIASDLDGWTGWAMDFKKTEYLA
ncbi:MAG: hypothetical protein MJZ20_08390 [Bacteroidaceae bacterium]|nr:hypothetical protein [Bacteroidaceae bacterium]